MDTVIIVVLIVVTMGLVVWVLLRSKNSGGNDVLLMLERRISDLSRQLDEKIGQSSRDMHDSVKHQLGESQKLVRDVTEKLTRLDETNKQVVSFADQLKNLQDILKNPKQRGILGEYYLETVLKNVLPPGRFAMQYKFKDGEIVDAVVFLDKDKILPIDSKFSLENYNRFINEVDGSIRDDLAKSFMQDVKIRIDETSKYIRPSEDTMDFAMMFIPSEAIYYDLLVNKVGAGSAARDIIEYAFKDKHVIIVSPTSFLAYLQTVLQGLRALKIEESAKEIRKRVEDLGKHLAAYEQHMGALGNSLGTTVNHFNKARGELGKIDKDVVRIAGFSPQITGDKIERPTPEEEG